MSEKTLFLHIGTHKTATTTIQRFCAENREALQKNGFIYPEMPFTYPGQGATRNGLFLGAYCYNPDNSRDTDEESRRLHCGMDIIHDSFLHYDNVLLSEERLYRTLSANDCHLLKVLHNDSLSHNYNIRLIICLRRQDGHKEALWNQQVKGSARYCKDFCDYTAGRNIFDYCAILDSFENVIGRDSISVIRFSDLISGDGVIQNFLSILGLELTDDYQINNARTNSRLYGNTVEIMRTVNSIPEISNKERHFFRKSLFIASEAAKSNCICSEFSEEERRSFMKEYEEGNAEIAERYLNDGKPLFSDDYSGPPKRSTSDPEFINDIIRTFAYEDIMLYRELQDTRKRLNKLEKKYNRMRHPLKTIYAAIRKKFF